MRGEAPSIRKQNFIGRSRVLLECQCRYGVSLVYSRLYGMPYHHSC